MIKTTIIPYSDNFNITIPLNYIGKRLEVLFYSIDELAESEIVAKQKLSEKYRNVFTEDAAQSFNEHTRKMREDWNNI